MGLQMLFFMGSCMEIEIKSLVKILPQTSHLSLKFCLCEHCVSPGRAARICDNRHHICLSCPKTQKLSHNIIAIQKNIKNPLRSCEFFLRNSCNLDQFHFEIPDHALLHPAASFCVAGDLHHQPGEDKASPPIVIVVLNINVH